MVETPMRVPIAAGDFLTMSFPPDGQRYELVRGQVVPRGPSTTANGILGVALGAALMNSIRLRRLGYVGGGRGGCQLCANPDTVRAPSVWFLSAHRVPATGLPDGYWRGAPDLVAELLSPSDRATAIFQRVQDYLETGSRLLWLIDPESRSAVVLRPDQMPRFVGEDGALDGEDVLPGFRVPLGDLCAVVPADE
jgi:Uma2 family endonuclease